MSIDGAINNSNSSHISMNAISVQRKVQQFKRCSLFNHAWLSVDFVLFLFGWLRFKNVAFYLWACWIFIQDGLNAIGKFHFLIHFQIHCNSLFIWITFIGQYSFTGFMASMESFVRTQIFLRNRCSMLTINQAN